MRGDEPEPWDGRDPIRRSDAVDRPDELREIGLRAEIQAPTGPALCPDMTEPWIRREIVAIRIHVLSEERHFLEARSGDRSCLGDNFVERAAPLWATTERHDAVGAGLVAAIDDRQPGRDARRPLDGAGFHGRRAGDREMIGNPDNRSPNDGRGADDTDRCLGRCKTKSIQQFRLLVWSEEQIDRRVSPFEAVPVPFANRAAGQNHTHRSVGILEALEVPLPSDDLLLGQLADGAGVDHHEIGLVHRRRLNRASGQQSAGHLLRVAPVHLAAERPDVKPRQGARLRAKFAEAGVLRLVAAPSFGGRRRRDLEDRETAGAAGWSFDHRLAADPAMAARSGPSTVGGTHKRAWVAA